LGKEELGKKGKYSVGSTGRLFPEAASRRSKGKTFLKIEYRKKRAYRKLGTVPGVQVREGFIAREERPEEVGGS